MLLAQRLVTPIKALQVGARQLEASNFGHRIEVSTKDEMGELAEQFNRMADELQGSYGRLEQKVEERTRDLAKSNSELKALEEIGRAVASSLDTKAVLGTIVTRAVELSQADAGAIYTYDADRGLFELAGVRRVSSEDFRSAPVAAARIRLDERALGTRRSAGRRSAIRRPLEQSGISASGELIVARRIQVRPGRAAGGTGRRFWAPWCCSAAQPGNFPASASCRPSPTSRCWRSTMRGCSAKSSRRGASLRSRASTSPSSSPT